MAVFAAKHTECHLPFAWLKSCIAIAWGNCSLLSLVPHVLKSNLSFHWLFIFMFPAVFVFFFQSLTLLFGLLVITPLSLPTQFHASTKSNSLSLSPTPLPPMSYPILKKHNYRLEPPISKLKSFGAKLEVLFIIFTSNQMREKFLLFNFC